MVRPTINKNVVKAPLYASKSSLTRQSIGKRRGQTQRQFCHEASNSFDAFQGVRYHLIMMCNRIQPQKDAALSFTLHCAVPGCDFHMPLARQKSVHAQYSLQSCHYKIEKFIIIKISYFNQTESPAFRYFDCVILTVGQHFASIVVTRITSVNLFYIEVSLKALQ